MKQKKENKIHVPTNTSTKIKYVHPNIIKWNKIQWNN